MPTLKLRQDTVRSVPYQGPGGKHQCVYWDVTFEGFGLRVYPSGRRVYVYFKREKLYELVWMAPVMEIARRLGVSDVALAKLCRRAAIPMPHRGYWARIESGQQIAAAPLPPAPAGLPELLRIRGTQPPADDNRRSLSHAA